MTRSTDALANLTAPLTSVATRGATTAIGHSLAAGHNAFSGLFSQHLLQAEPTEPDAAILSGFGPPLGGLLLTEEAVDSASPEATDAEHARQQSLSTIISEASEQMALLRQMRRDGTMTQGPVENPDTPTLAQIIRDLIAARSSAADHADDNASLFGSGEGGLDNIEPNVLGNLDLVTLPNVQGGSGRLPSQVELISAAVSRSYASTPEGFSRALTNSNVGSSPENMDMPSALAPSAQFAQTIPRTSSTSAASSLMTAEAVGSTRDIGPNMLQSGLTAPSPSAESVTPVTRRGKSIFSTNNSSPPVQNPNSSSPFQIPNSSPPVQNPQMPALIDQSAESPLNDGGLEKLTMQMAVGDTAAPERKTPARRASDATSLTSNTMQPFRAPETLAFSSQAAEQPLPLKAAPTVAATESLMPPGFDKADATPVHSAAAEPSTADSLSQSAPLEIETPEWEMSLVERISANLKEGGARIELALTPERLGKLEVKMELSDGHAEVTFVTETREAAKLISQAEGRLSDLLARSGFNLGGQDSASREDTGQRNASPSQPEVQDETKTLENIGGVSLGQGMLNLIA